MVFITIKKYSYSDKIIGFVGVLCIMSAYLGRWHNAKAKSRGNHSTGNLNSEVQHRAPRCLAYVKDIFYSI